jgi:hypothetical protein
MGISRKDALKRLRGLAFRVEEHLRKLAEEPDSQDAPHWRYEAGNWIRQMEDVLFAVGKGTGADWSLRLEEWKRALGDEP